MRKEALMTRETDAYDWNRRGRHRLRAPAAVVIDLPVPAASDAHLWVATIWPDDRAGGWARTLWEPEPSRRRWRRDRVRSRHASTTGAVVRNHGLLRARPLGHDPRPVPDPDRRVARRAAPPRARTIPPRATNRTAGGVDALRPDRPTTTTPPSPTPVDECCEPTAIPTNRRGDRE